jgi:type II secretion system protein N
MIKKLINALVNLIARIDYKQAVIYSAVFLSVFLLTFYLTFPFETIKGLMVSQMEAKTGTKVVMNSLEPVRMSGIEMHGLKMLKPEDPSLVVADIDLFRFRFHLLPFFTGRIIMDYDLIAYGGGLSGTMEARSKGRMALAVNFKDLDLQKYNFKKAVEKFGEMDLVGKLSGNFNMYYDTMNKRASQGALNLTFDGVQVTKAKFLSKELPDVNFKPGAIKMDYAQNALTIKEWQMEGDNLALNMTGRITLGANLKSSRVALNLKAKPSENLMTKFGELLAFKSPDEDGWYDISINGPLDKPKTNIR